ncbi:MAG TPA: MFS transporter [Streptosporangiaceae bacterium]
MTTYEVAERVTELSRAGRRRRRVTLVALSLTFALVQLDATIVNVALQTLRTDLGGGVSAAQWAVDGYAIPFAACMLTAGALGDRHGHRRICLLGFALFGVASAGAALAGGWPVLIGARVGAIGVALLGAVLNAGGVRTGFVVALGLAAAVCAVALVSTVEATAVRRRAADGQG